ncbi:MAG: type II toxin-antitoxin system RelB/DinJ family antitoxin [Clostridiales bacterium]|nr:type II toxin-antitoxin system RelB/DinJ family antitoxin [Clostridiales bacterium]
MEKTTTLNLRVNPVVKKRAEAVLEVLGIPMSTAIDIYLNQISLTGGIPFPVTIPKAPESINMDLMTSSEIHSKLDKGYQSAVSGRTYDAETAFEAFRKEHKE